MKRYLFFLITLLCLSACQKERLLRNPNLGEARFSYSLNTNLPLYNVLKSDFSTVFVPYGGIKGFFVTHLKVIVLSLVMTLINTPLYLCNALATTLYIVWQTEELSVQISGRVFIHCLIMRYR